MKSTRNVFLALAVSCALFTLTRCGKLGVGTGGNGVGPLLQNDTGPVKGTLNQEPWTMVDGDAIYLAPGLISVRLWNLSTRLPCDPISAAGNQEEVDLNLAARTGIATIGGTAENTAIFRVTMFGATNGTSAQSGNVNIASLQNGSIQVTFDATDNMGTFANGTTTVRICP